MNDSFGFGYDELGELAAMRGPERPEPEAYEDWGFRV